MKLIFVILCLSPAKFLNLLEMELESNFEILRKKDVNPYYMEYQVVFEQRKELEASLGSITKDFENKKGYFSSRIRVGDYSFDSSIYPDELYFPGEEESEIRQILIHMNIPCEENKLWKKLLSKFSLRSYQIARIRYFDKKAKKIQEFSEDTLPSFTREKAETFIDTGKYKPVDLKKVREILKDVSKIFKKEPDILSSGVAFYTIEQRKYFVDTEGRKIFENRNYNYIYVYAETKAIDGMWVSDFESFFFFEEKDMPSSDSIIRCALNIIKNVRKMKSCEIQESYKGPVLIVSPGAGVFFHEILGHRLEGHRQRSRIEGEIFKEKLGERILPAFLNVYDAPDLKYFKKFPLSGFYRFDEEGIKAKKVNLIERGVLKRFLLSRRPLLQFKNSNGHGRASPFYLLNSFNPPVPRQGNLIIENLNPLPVDSLKKLLIQECKKQGKEYGIIIEKITEGRTQTTKFTLETFESEPIVAKRLWVNGKEEYIRGIRFGGTPLISLKNIVALGDDPGCYNGFCGAESGSIPVGIVSPSVLIREMELAKREKSYLKPPIIPPP